MVYFVVLFGDYGRSRVTNYRIKFQTQATQQLIMQLIC